MMIFKHPDLSAKIQKLKGYPTGVTVHTLFSHTTMSGLKCGFEVSE